MLSLEIQRGKNPPRHQKMMKPTEQHPGVGHSLHSSIDSMNSVTGKSFVGSDDTNLQRQWSAKTESLSKNKSKTLKK